MLKIRKGLLIISVLWGLVVSLDSLNYGPLSTAGTLPCKVYCSTQSRAFCLYPASCHIMYCFLPQASPSPLETKEPRLRTQVLVPRIQCPCHLAYGWNCVWKQLFHSYSSNLEWMFGLHQPRLCPVIHYPFLQECSTVPGMQCALNQQ